jgi:acetaldehyde dehydrogenase / alcohol dehydrogenase
VLVTEHGGLGHTSAVYARDDDVVRPLRDGRPHRPHPRQRADRGRRARRRLQRAHADVLAGLRHLGRLADDRERQLPQLLNVKTVSRRRTPPQWFRVPPDDVYFNAGALENLRQLDARRS